MKYLYCKTFGNSQNTYTYMHTKSKNKKSVKNITLNHLLFNIEQGF